LRSESGDAGNADTPSREERGLHSKGDSHTLTILFKIPRQKAHIIYEAVAPEAETLPSRRTSVSLQASEKGLILRIAAQDLVALRAAMNSFLRFINAVLDVLNLTEEKFSQKAGMKT